MSSLRAAMFASWGMVAFTRPAFLLASRRFEPLPDLTGRSIVVTGASSGLGFAASVALAKLNADVHIVCRDRVRGEKARKDISDAAGKGSVTLHTLDLSNLSSIAPFVDEMTEKLGGKLHVLVNNAGLLNNELKLTAEGVEEARATNLLGTFHLTELMVPHMAENGRVITVSSGGAYTASLTDLLGPAPSSYDGVFNYAMQKRGQIEMTEAWAKLYPSIRFYSCHPGWASTPGVARSLPGLNATGSMLRTSEMGADVILWLAATNEKLTSGGFYFDRAEAVKHMKLAGTQSKAGQVKKLFESLIGEVGGLVGEQGMPYKSQLETSLLQF